MAIDTTKGPLRLYEVLEEEFKTLHGALPPMDQKTDDSRLAEIYRHIHVQNHAALCLSGGGIRSASFGLGVLQGLARHHWLEKFDFLSTVSGGGYIGSWMTAWIHRHRRGRQGVVDELRTFRESRIDPEHEPIRCLREYSHYLTPQWGLLSADTWTWVAIYLRNLFLNWLVLVPLLAAALAIPRLCVEVILLNPDRDKTSDLLATWGWGLGPFSTLLVIGGFVLAVLAIDYANLNLPTTGQNKGQGSFLLGCLLPLACAAVALTTSWAWFRNSQPAQAGLPGPGALMLFGLVLHLAGCSAYLFRSTAKESVRDLEGILPASGILLIIIAAGGVGGFLVWCAATTDFFAQPKNGPEFYVCFAAPVLLTLFILATALYIGLASYITSDADREWWARAGGWVLIAVLCWIVVSWLVLFGPATVAGLEGLAKQTVLGLGGIAGLVTILMGKSAVTPANWKEREQTGWLALLWSQAATLAAPIFAAFIVVGISFVTGWLLTLLAKALVDFQSVVENSLLLLCAFIVLLLAVGLVMGFFINANKFSLHGAYRDRLIRAYLGASHEDRHPNFFTGFDPTDNMPMHVLQLGQQTKKFERPFHVVNITLNLVKGGNLAWQERKAESFTATPLHSGSYRLGYRSSEQYGGRKGLDGGDGISLGTAVTISGAAASPNWGYHSSPLVTFLLALFNVRLGWWLGNPGSAGARTFRNRGPSFAVWPLIEETFGLTTDTNEYVYRSDGGHFENLGLYEMVLRRCRLIMVSDAGCDPKCELEDLGNAIRKIRVDFGIPIEFEDGFHIHARNAVKGKRWALATIRYSAVDAGAQDGFLIYLKPAFLGDEPIDIFNYANAHPQFPHESTLDQWFSESQFESYRMLGVFTVEQVLPELQNQDWQGTSLEIFAGDHSKG